MQANTASTGHQHVRIAEHTVIPLPDQQRERIAYAMQAMLAQMLMKIAPHVELVFTNITTELRRVAHVLWVNTALNLRPLPASPAKRASTRTRRQESQCAKNAEHTDILILPRRMQTIARVMQAILVRMALDIVQRAQ